MDRNGEVVPQKPEALESRVLYLRLPAALEPDAAAKKATWAEIFELRRRQLEAERAA